MNSPRLPRKRERLPRLDLSLGSPLFLQSYWQTPSRWPATQVPADVGHLYFEKEVDKALESEVIQLHKMVGNANTEGRHVVFGNGATQLLGALVSVLKKTNGNRVFSKAPYYFRFPDIVQSAGGDFYDMFPEKADIEIVTSPSNPLNQKEDGETKGLKIFDLCYNWPTYTKVVKADHDIMVFSLSKATGHAASRIGWILLKDEDLAKELREHLEIQSGGTSVESRMRATQILRGQVFEMISDEPETVFDFGRKVLDRRWSELHPLSSGRMFPINGFGMFAYLFVDPTGELSIDATRNMLRKYDILGRSGLVCGGGLREVRINMGCSEADFQELIKRLKSGGVSY